MRCEYIYCGLLQKRFFVVYDNFLVERREGSIYRIEAQAFLSEFSNTGIRWGFVFRKEECGSRHFSDLVFLNLSSRRVL